MSSVRAKLIAGGVVQNLAVPGDIDTLIIMAVAMVIPAREASHQRQCRKEEK